MQNSAKSNHNNNQNCNSLTGTIPEIVIISSSVLTGLPSSSSSSLMTTEITNDVIEQQSQVEEGCVRIPLMYKNDAYQISYRISGTLFNAIVDTGSPFLMTPGGSCARISRRRWGGCFNDIFLNNDNSIDNDIESSITNLDPTYEYFDGVEGWTQWKIGTFYFENATGTILVPDNSNDNPSSSSSSINTDNNKNKKLIFGVASDTLMAGPGGIFFGLIRDTDKRIRPSFLGQTNVKSFQLDFISNPCTLMLSTNSLLTKNNSTSSSSSSSITTTNNNLCNCNNCYIPLVNDLKKFGDPARHYTAKVSSIAVNGHLLASSTKNQPIYAIFDTGVTGMVISRELYNKRYNYATENREKSFWGFVELSFQTIPTTDTNATTNNNADSSNVTMFASKPVTTPLNPSSWTNKYNTPYVIVLGLSFLNNTMLTIDIDEEKLWVQSKIQ